MSLKGYMHFISGKEFIHNDDNILNENHNNRNYQKENAPLLSVIVAIYNVATYLQNALESLHMQTMQEAEFILVDDGSTDESDRIMNEYARCDKRFKFIHLERNIL